ncbi:MAG: CofH family radical SAM protein [Cyanobacteriota bacterium]|nr:CofH family radical SAM protein [Cyanobacteriota bacterium]
MATLASLHAQQSSELSRFIAPGLGLLELDPDPGALQALREHADQLRQRLVGDTVTYVVNRNLNVSNHCSKHCGFCAFRRDPGEEGAYWLERDDLMERAAQARAEGATELCVQGGLNPAATLNGSFTAYAEQLLRDLHSAAPGLHLHAFSPQELLFFAECDGISLAELIRRLQANGLGSVPGTAAEVLSERVRRVLCPEKLSARAWCAVILEVHASGLASTATLMAGHLEAPADRLAHLLTLLALQRDAQRHDRRGFSEFVLLPFVGQAAPAVLRQRVGRDQPDREAMLLLTAQARLLLGPAVANHQPSWVKLTMEGATEALRWGCNDLGGTLMEEHITSMAGARGGTSQTPQAMEAAARSVGRPVRQRLTLYDGAIPGAGTSL